MAKPARYSRIDRTRKALGIQFRTRIPSLLHQRNYLSILHIQKSILAAQALRRCVDLETWITNTMQALDGFPVSSGVCMCGETMEGHPGAMACSHTPCDSGDYFLSELKREAALLLAKPMVDAPKNKPYSYLQMQQQVNHGLWQLKQADRTIAALTQQVEDLKKELFLQTARGEPYDGC